VVWKTRLKPNGALDEEDEEQRDMGGGVELYEKGEIQWEWGLVSNGEMDERAKTVLSGNEEKGGVASREETWTSVNIDAKIRDLLLSSSVDEEDREKKRWSQVEKRCGDRRFAVRYQRCNSNRRLSLTVCRPRKTNFCFPLVPF
jgi:hypothetical protein